MHIFLCRPEHQAAIKLRNWMWGPASQLVGELEAAFTVLWYSEQLNFTQINSLQRTAE